MHLLPCQCIFAHRVELCFESTSATVAATTTTTITTYYSNTNYCLTHYQHGCNFTQNASVLVVALVLYKAVQSPRSTKRDVNNDAHKFPMILGLLALIFCNMFPQFFNFALIAILFMEFSYLCCSTDVFAVIYEY